MCSKGAVGQPRQRVIHSPVEWLVRYPSRVPSRVGGSGPFDGLAHEPRRHGVRWCVSCPLNAPAGRGPPLGSRTAYSLARRLPVVDGDGVPVPQPPRGCDRACCRMSWQVTRYDPAGRASTAPTPVQRPSGATTARSNRPTSTPWPPSALAPVGSDAPALSRTLVRMELAHYAEAFTVSRGRCFRFVAGDDPHREGQPAPCRRPAAWRGTF
jgi:hypothetical protein